MSIRGINRCTFDHSLWCTLLISAACLITFTPNSIADGTESHAPTESQPTHQADGAVTSASQERDALVQEVAKLKAQNEELRAMNRDLLDRLSSPLKYQAMEQGNLDALSSATTKEQLKNAHASTTKSSSKSGSQKSNLDMLPQSYEPPDASFKVKMPSAVQTQVANNRHTYHATTASINYLVGYTEMPTDDTTSNQLYAVGFLQGLYKKGINSRKTKQYKVDGYDALEYQLWSPDGKQGKLVFIAGKGKLFSFQALTPGSAKSNEWDTFFDSIHVK